MTMVTAGCGADCIPDTREALRKWWWRHPEVPLLAASSVAWLVLGAEHLGQHQSGAATGWHFNVISWTLMVVAMMVPGIAPMYRRVAFDSLWSRRHRSAGLFAATYAGLWVAFAFVLVAGLAAFRSLAATAYEPGSRVVVGSLLVAAAWQLSPNKGRFLRRCHLRTPLAPRGWKADRDVLRYGWRHGLACIGSCGPVMTAMWLSSHAFHLMVPLAAVTISERYQRKPRTHIGAAVIGLVAVLATLS